MQLKFNAPISIFGSPKGMVENKEEDII